jgi:hypothetical protein
MNDLLYRGRRELHETDRLKSALSTIRIKRDSLPSSSRRTPTSCYYSSAHYSAAGLPETFDYEEDAEESENELFLEFPSRHTRMAADSPLSIDPPDRGRRVPNVLEDALLQQPDESTIAVEDALNFVSEMCCRPRQSGRSRSSSRPSSGRVRTPRSRNSQSGQSGRAGGSRGTVRIEAPT